MTSATVVGAGVSGLTTALTLARGGLPVRLVATEIPGRTSTLATAMWHLYKVDPLDITILRWAERTLEVLVGLASIPSAGIEIVPGVELFRTAIEETPAFVDFTPTYRRLGADEINRHFPGINWGYELRTPVVDMNVYMPWLREECESEGVQFVERAIDDLEQAREGRSFVVNCTGLASRELAGDGSLFGVKGQYVVVDDPKRRWNSYIGDDENPAGMAYYVPRNGQVIVGGTEEPRETLDFDQDVDALIDRAFAFAGDKPSAGLVVDRVVGLRPCRANGLVRLGFDDERPWLIHNYGHGGSGLSLSWGCAEDVLALLQ